MRERIIRSSYIWEYFFDENLSRYGQKDKHKVDRPLREIALFISTIHLLAPYLKSRSSTSWDGTNFLSTLLYIV